MTWSRFKTDHATWIDPGLPWETPISRHCEIVERHEDYMLMVTDDMRIRVEPGFNDNQVHPGWINPKVGMVFDINGKLI